MLADDAVREFITAFQPQISNVLQVEPLFESAGAFVKARGNRQCNLSFGVSREHADDATALEFLATHATTFDSLSNVDLKIEVGAKITYLVNAVIQSIVADPQNGRSTFIRYAFVSASYTTIAP